MTSDLDRSTQAGEAEETARFEAVVARVLEQARARGATAAEASLGAGTGLSVTARLGEVETIEHNRDKGLSITVYFGGRKGSASTSDFADAALADTVEAACLIASKGGEDEHAGLAAADRMARDLPDLDLDHPWEITAEAALERALRMEKVAREADPRITNSEGGTVSTRRATRVYGNTHGFIGSYRATRHSLSAVVIAEADGAMQRDYWYSTARRAVDLETEEAIGAHAAERTLRRLGARQIETCRVPVLYAAEVAGSLLGHLVGAVSGASLYRQASFLLDHLGKRVFPGGVRIHEQPRLPGAMGSAPFDAEGVATEDRDLIADGVLERYVLGSYSARRLGMASTGNAGGVRNLTLEPWAAPGVAPRAPDEAALLAAMGRGLYVTELIGMGVNTVTGDYSRGAAGFWIEDGEPVYPVEEITVAGNLRDMFANLLGAATNLDTRGNLRTGSVLVEEMTVAGG